MKIEAVVFDFDGVILESVAAKTQAFARMFEKYGPETVEQVVEYHIENGGLSRLVKLEHYHRLLLGQDVDQAFLDKRAAEFSVMIVDQVIEAEWVPGAKEFLEGYHSQLPLFVCSGTPQDELRMIVGRRNMSRFFKEVYGSPETKEIILTRILGTLKLPPESVSFVGDAMTDYRAAKAAGVRFIGRGDAFEGLEVESRPDLRELAGLVGLG